jgi:hypothetical protein
MDDTPPKSPFTIYLDRIAGMLQGQDIALEEIATADAWFEARKRGIMVWDECRTGVLH